MNQGKVIGKRPNDVVPSPLRPDYIQLLLSSVPKMNPDWLTKIEEARA